MQTPTTTMRAPAGASRSAPSMIPGTPIASKTTSAAAADPVPGVERRLDRAGRPPRWRPSARPAPGGPARSRPRRCLDALQLQRRDHREADRAAAEHERALARRDAPTGSPRGGRPPSARSARRGEGRGRSGPRAAAAPRAASARRSRRASCCCRRSGRSPVIDSRIGIEVTSVPGASDSVSLPTSSTSAENSWPMNTSRERSIFGGSAPMDGHALASPRRGRASAPPCFAKCRSEPQMPQACTCTST